MTLNLAVCQSVPVGLDWLTGAERRVFDGLRLAVRRESWLLGRWAAKTALAHRAGAKPAGVEILAAEDGAPECALGAVSIAHRAGCAIALAGPRRANLGCDLELIEPRSRAFVIDYFLPDEQITVDQSEEPEVVANLIWCGKEAALKIARTGLRRDTRSVQVTVRAPLAVSSKDHPDNFVPLDIDDLETGALISALASRWSGFVMVLAATDPFEIQSAG